MEKKKQIADNVHAGLKDPSRIEAGGCHRMKLKSPYFEEIKEGRKRVEMRLFDEKRRQIPMGDTILFVHEGYPEEQVKVLVTGLYRYPSFEDLLYDFSPLELGFPRFSREEIREVLAGIYSAEQEKRYGVLAIGVHVI